MYEKRIKLIIGAIVISLVLGIIAAINFSGEKLSLIVDSLVTAEATYLIDDDGQEVTLYKIDKNGKKIASITEDKLDGDEVAIFSNLMIDGGNIYVYKIVREIERGNIVLSEEVYYCDFDTGNLVLSWKLPMNVDYAQNNVFPTVQNGTLYFFNYTFDFVDREARAVLNKMEEGSVTHTVEAVTDYSGDVGFTSLAYTKSGDVVFVTPEGKIFKALPPDEVKETPMVEIKTPSNELFEMENNVWQPPSAEDIANQKLSEQSGDGTVYVENELVPVQIYPYGSEEDTGGLIGDATTDDGNSIYFLRFDTKQYINYDASTDIFEDIDVPTKFNDAYIQIAEYDIKNISFTDNNSYSGSIMGDFGEGDKLVVYEDYKATIISEVIKTNGQVFLSFVIYTLGALAIFVIVYVLWEVFLLFTRGKVPVVAKVIALCIPVVVVSGFILQTLINNIFVEQIVENLYKELYLLSEEKQSALISAPNDIIEMDNPYLDNEYVNLQGLFNNLPPEAIIHEQETGNEYGIYNFSYHYFYSVKDGKLRSLIASTNTVNTPVDYMYSAETVNMFYEAANNKEIISGNYRDLEGEWVVIVNPIMNSDGEVIGILESGASKTFLEYQVNKNTTLINFVNFVIQVILIALLSLLIMICLRPLKHLKNSVNEITNGNMGVQAKIRGRDEIADIGNVFNSMSKSVEVSVNELRLLNEGYFKFVPSKVFSILRKSSVIDVKLGDEISTNIAVFTVNGNKFDDVMGDLSSDKMFDLINGMYSSMVPIVSKYNGVVDRFEQAGLVAFFTDEVSNAIDTAITIAQKSDILNAQRQKSGLPIVEVSSAICYGTVMLGIVGHEKRLSATTISQYTQLSAYLRRIAPIYGARIITTETVVNKIKGFDEKYNYRYLGYIHIDSTNQTEKIYDVFDGDMAEDKVLKRDTREIFEKAVNLYTDREFYEARLLFIEVLKLNRNDLAAKEYLYRCDKYYQLEEKDQNAIDIFIEQY